MPEIEPRKIAANQWDNERLIMEWRQDPVLAAREIFNVKLAPFQRQVLRSRWKASTQIDIFTRGGGKTFLDGLTCGLAAILYPGDRVGIIAPSYRQSKLVFAEVEKLYERSPLFQEAVKKFARTPEICYFQFHHAEGKNSSYIGALPMGTDGAKIRGERFFKLIVDEGAQVEDTSLDVVARGFLATSNDPMERVEFMAEQRRKIQSGEMKEEDLINPDQNKLIISSTAYYQYNHLWRRCQNMVEEINKQYKEAIRSGATAQQIKDRFTLLGASPNEGQFPYRIMSNGEIALTAFPYTDPPEGFMNMKSVIDAKRDMSEYLFKMEYCCFFPPDSHGFFRKQMLDNARRHKEFSCQLVPRQGMKYAMGIDPARENDNFAISIYEVDSVNRQINLVRILAWNKKDFLEMHHNVRRLIRLYKIECIEMDSGGGGTTIRDLLANEHNKPAGDSLILEKEYDPHMMKSGRKILEPLFNFSNASLLHDANHNLLGALQHGVVRIAAPPPVGNEIWTQELEDADEEIEKCILEMASIIKSVSGQRERWDTPTKTQRKDRYSAAMLGYVAAQKVLDRAGRPQTLAMGGFG